MATQVFTDEELEELFRFFTLTPEHVRMFGDPHGLITRVAIGCGGGRHRAPVIAHEVATALTRAGIGAEAVHRDIDRAVLH